jgi:hypothetical protein
MIVCPTLMYFFVFETAMGDPLTWNQLEKTDLNFFDCLAGSILQCQFSTENERERKYKNISYNLLTLFVTMDF